MSNIISFDFHKLKRTRKDEFIALKNAYLKMGVLERAQRRLHCERQLQLAPTRFITAYYTHILNAYLEVDNG